MKPRQDVFDMCDECDATRIGDMDHDNKHLKSPALKRRCHDLMELNRGHGPRQQTP